MFKLRWIGKAYLYSIYNHQKGVQPMKSVMWSCFGAAVSYVVSASPLSVTQKIEEEQADMQRRDGSLLFVRSL